MADIEIDEAPKKKGGLVKKLMVFIGFIVFAAGGFGGGMFYSGQQLSPSEEVLRLIERDEIAQAEAEEEAAGPQRVVREIPEEELFETSYHEFEEPLTTNLNGSRSFLQVAVGLSTTYDAQVIENVTLHEMALRSDMLAVISSFSEADVEGTTGRHALADAMKDAINARLLELEGFGGIEDVFFPSFVLQ